MRIPLRHLAPLVPVFLALAAHAQNVASGKPDPKYAGESFLIERSESRDVMAADGTGYRERTVSVRIQSDAALRELSVLSLPFASASQKVEIVYARARRPDGTVVETPPGDALEQPEPVTKEAPFYSDLKDKQLPIKNLRVGDTLEWKARIVRTKAEAPGNFWGAETFFKDVVSLSENYELRVPKAVSVNVWTNPRLNLKPTESDDGNDHIYRWETSSLKPTAGAEADAAKAAKKKKMLTPEEELDSRHGVLPSIAWTTFKSWAAVGAWYRSLESGRVVPDDQIKAKVAELTAGKSTDEEKVRAVYSFVAPQIRYIGVAFGVGRYQPHLASEVLENQYGDCKDKHTLLAAMLTALGLHPDAVLIGDGIRFNEAVPSPEAFNHVITRVPVGGQPVWLDATAEVAPYRVLAFDLRDKQALIVPDTGDAAVVRTPADLPFPAFINMKASGSIDKDGVTTSHIELSLRGDVELFYRMVLRQIAPAQYGEFVQRVSQNMGYSGTTSHVEIGRPEDTAGPLVISYDYRRERAEDWVNTRIVAQLEPLSLPGVDEKEPPIESINLGVPHTESSTAELKIPANWTAELPEAVHEKTPYATYDETFRFEKGTIYAERHVAVLKQYVAAGDWKPYKKFADDIHLGEEMYIGLVRGAGEKGSSASSTAAVATVSNAKAAKLIEQAFSALDKRDFAAATPLLEQAKAINPTQKNLAGAYGALSFDRGEMSEAIRNYQKELSLHPDSVWVYSPMARAQTIMGHRDEAETSLREWMAAAPDDPTPIINLVNTLIDADDGAAALQAANKGIAALPEDKRTDPQLQFALGKAQIAAGSETNGAATLVALLKDSDDVFMMNNAAYELAKAFKELPLAESIERKALDKLGAESRTWTLDESPQTLKGKTSLIVASWDTLGWILFREGKYQDAEDYVHAAWVNSAHAEVGEHLGDIQDQLDQHQEAMKTYELTLATIPGYNLLGVKTAPGADSKRLKDKIDAQKRAGAKPGHIDAQSALTHQRSLSLGAAGGLQGEAEYVVLLAHDRIEKAQPAGEKSVPGGAELILKADAAHFTPAGSDAKLAKFAILNCHSGTCDLIFEP